LACLIQVPAPLGAATRVAAAAGYSYALCSRCVSCEDNSVS